MQPKGWPTRKHLLLSALLAMPLAAAAQLPGSVGDTATAGVTLSAAAELGFLAVLGHDIQFSRNGTKFRYIKEGGQDILFPVSRLSLNLTRKRHTFVLLYQPLRLQTTGLPSQDLVIDSLTFPRRTPMNFLYDFPFYRFSYLFELTPPGGRFDAGLG